MAVLFYYPDLSLYPMCFRVGYGTLVRERQHDQENIK